MLGGKTKRCQRAIRPGRILRCRPDLPQGIQQDQPPQGAQAARRGGLQDGRVLPAHQHGGPQLGRLPERHPIRLPRQHGPLLPGPQPAVRGEIQGCRQELPGLSRDQPAELPGQKRHTGLQPGRPVERESYPLCGEEGDDTQLAPQRLRPHVSGERLRPALLHLVDRKGSEQKQKRYHRHQKLRQLLLEERRTGGLAETRTHRGRCQYRRRRRRHQLQPRRYHHVPEQSPSRAQRRHLGRDLHLYPYGCSVEPAAKIRNHRRHPLGLRPAGRIARRRIPLLRLRHAGRIRGERPVAHLAHRPGGVAREPGCTNQHPGRRDVPLHPRQRRPLLRLRRPPGHGRPRHLPRPHERIGHVANREHEIPHQLVGRRLRHHLRRGGDRLLLVQPGRRPGLRQHLQFRAPLDTRVDKRNGHRQGRRAGARRHHPHRGQRRLESKGVCPQGRQLPFQARPRRALRDAGLLPRLPQLEAGVYLRCRREGCRVWRQLRARLHQQAYSHRKYLLRFRPRHPAARVGDLTQRTGEDARRQPQRVDRAGSPHRLQG